MNFLYLTVLFPLAGFLLLAFSRGRWSENFSALIGVGSIGLSALITVFVGSDFLSQGVVGQSYPVFTQELWHWMRVDNFAIDVTLTLDGLSFTLLSVVTGVGFLIHLFASWYMRGEEGYSRFFAYTNLFIASMLVLVLADNLLLMYLGWEGVGLCSYLLIGFYYSNPENGKAAMKAFVITRVGDVFLAFALFILWSELGTLSFREIIMLAPTHFTQDTANIVAGKTTLEWATLFLLGGAVGKSAQLPLQTWLADAMAGPTPVSALIHAATMVTAGVYLIARTNGLFLMTPGILNLVGIVGALTLLLAGFAALVQTDIKRVLAYSTMSQIGYMFMALGSQIWDAAIFHLMTHAFFKALLFLASGSVILACHHEQNIFKMGGLYKRLPLVYACFLVGGSALAAVPLLTAGFYSKDEILFGALANGRMLFVVVGLIGAFLTSLYTFRLIFVVFHGEEKQKHVHVPEGITHHFPLMVLLVLSTFVGASIMLPLEGIFPVMHVDGKHKMLLEAISGGVVIVGVLLAALLWLGNRSFVFSMSKHPVGQFFGKWWFAAWGFDWLYDKLFVKPWRGVAHLLSRDPFNAFMNFPVWIARLVNRGLLVSENGFLRWYIASMGIGALVVLLLMLTI